MKVLIVMFFSWLCLFSATSLAAATNGAVIASSGDGNGAPCTVCHGSQGEGNNIAGFPRLAGLNQGYLVKQLNDYIQGRRESQIMTPNVDNLSSAQVTAVAKYYANLAIPSGGASSSELSELGRSLMLNGDWSRYVPPCASCHGRDSRGVGASFPALAGQHASYIIKELQRWKNGTRTNDPLGLMANIAKRLSDQQIQALGTYLASLDPADTHRKASSNE